MAHVPFPALHSPSVQGCHTPDPVPPLPFLPASTVFSAHAVQVCCTLQPIMGFARFRASPGPWLHLSPSECSVSSGGPALSPFLETDRLVHDASRRVDLDESSSVGVRAPTQAPEGACHCQGWSKRSPAGTRSFRTASVESSLRHSHPRRFRRLAKSARCHQPSCSVCLSRRSHRRDALRSVSLTHSLVRFQGSRSLCPLVVQRTADLEAFVHV
jgi:hypothetical protein